MKANGNGLSRPEQIVKKYNEDKARYQLGELSLTSKDLLILKSRSFAFPIVGLQKYLGEHEADKMLHMMTLYNLLRFQDTIEDCKLKPEQKISLLNDWDWVINEATEREKDSSIKDLVDGSLAKIVNTLSEKREVGKGKKKREEGYLIGEEEEIFVDQFGSGLVLRDFVGFDSGLRESYLNCMQKMATGMKRFLGDGPIKTSTDLKRYCEYVAGYVGVAINDTVSLEDRLQDGEYLSRDEAMGYGVYLQSINITKNINEDVSFRDARYVPTEFGEGEDAVNRMLAFAHSYFDDAVAYNLSIPDRLRGLAYFGLGPFLVAGETYKLMASNPAEVWNGNELYTKVGGNRVDQDENSIETAPGVHKNVLDFVGKIVTANEGRNRRDFVQDYGRNPENFSFKDGDYENWSDPYFTETDLPPVPESEEDSSRSATPTP